MEIRHSEICACRQCSTHFGKNSYSEMFEFFDNSKFFRSCLKKWSRGKTDPQEQIEWSTDYVLQKVHALLL